MQNISIDLRSIYPCVCLANSEHKKIRMAVFVSDKIDFRRSSITKDKGEMSNDKRVISSRRHINYKCV